MSRASVLQVVRLVLTVIPVVWMVACASPSDEPTEPRDELRAPRAETVQASAPGDSDWFVDVASSVGIDFEHQDGRSGRRFYVETVASGGGWVDVDADGDLDLYLVNGAATPGSELQETPTNKLYENRDGRFVDISEAAGVADPGYGMGLCIGDFDADGLVDLMVTNYGPDRLYRNLGSAGGHARFEDVSERAGVAGNRWGTNCAFTDVDGDRDLDLYVANYVDFSFAKNPRCGDVARDVWSYCRPAAFIGQGDSLFINQGDGTFIDQASTRGIDRGSQDRGFGVIASDLTGDGAVDLLVANDGTANRFYVNDGTGHFEDQGLAAGLALNRTGRAESGMGLALQDVDGDLLADLLVTNYSFETNTLYKNLGTGFFDDTTDRSGIGSASFLRVGWGAALFDFDNDGDPDLAVANGHVMDTIDLFEDGIGYPQPDSLFENDGRGIFADVTAKAGVAFSAPQVSRALAVGDWNDDGRLDLLITHTNGRPSLLENRLVNDNHWIGFRIEGGAAQPSALGTKVRVECESQVAEREVRSGGSLLAQDDLRLHFGLGSCRGPGVARVLWPDSHEQIETFDSVDLYRVLTRAPTGAAAESELP